MIKALKTAGKITSAISVAALMSHGLCISASAQMPSAEKLPAKLSAEADPVGTQNLFTAQQPEAVAQQPETDGGVDRIHYFGAGGTIGLSDEGDTALGSGGFSLVGRFSITDNLAVHTASAFGDNSIASVALTGGAPIRNEETGRIKLYPFLGAGVAVRTDEFEFDPLVTGGVDIPITDVITGTTRINASFGDDGTDVGLVLGIGANFLELF